VEAFEDTVLSNCVRCYYADI